MDNMTCQHCSGSDIQTLLVGRDTKCRCKACGAIWWSMAKPKFQVRFYAGKGVQIRSFFADQASEAEAFASQNRLYAKPCKVEEI